MNMQEEIEQLRALLLRVYENGLNSNWVSDQKDASKFEALEKDLYAAVTKKEVRECKFPLICNQTHQPFLITCQEHGPSLYNITKIKRS